MSGPVEVDCPRCHETCGWCGDYRWMHGQLAMPNGSGRKQYCRIPEMAPDDQCPTCGGSKRVFRTVSYVPAAPTKES